MPATRALFAQGAAQHGGRLMGAVALLALCLAAGAR